MYYIPMLVKRHLLSWIIMICLVSVHVLHPNVSKTTSIVLAYNDLCEVFFLYEMVLVVTGTDI
jgi:hypothetical protein